MILIFLRLLHRSNSAVQSSTKMWKYLRFVFFLCCVACCVRSLSLGLMPQNSLFEFKNKRLYHVCFLSVPKHWWHGCILFLVVEEIIKANFSIRLDFHQLQQILQIRTIPFCCNFSFWEKKNCNYFQKFYFCDIFYLILMTICLVNNWY